MSFQINEKVIHCRDGLCTIISMTKLNDKDFYIVKVSHGDAETTYVPFASADSIIRHIMSKEDADNLLKEMKKMEKSFVANTKQRRDAFKRLLSSGDVKDIAYMCRQYTLYKLDPEGVKLGAVDNDMLTHASNMLFDEFSLTYGVPREEIEIFMEERMKKL